LRISGEIRRQAEFAYRQALAMAYQLVPGMETVYGFTFSRRTGEIDRKISDTKSVRSLASMRGRASLQPDALKNG
jgi:hypothetical protein